MNQLAKFVAYLALLWLAAAGLVRYSHDNPPDESLRYQLHTADDGEVAVFDTATGEVWQIRKGDSPVQYFTPRPAHHIPQQRGF